MTVNRKAARVDDNQKEIVESLEKMGFSVQKGHDDIIVGTRRRNYWFEIKNPNRTLNKDGTWRKGALKASQIKIQAEWRGQYDVVHSLQQILDIIDGDKL